MWVTSRERAALVILGVAILLGAGVQVWQQQRPPLAVARGLAPAATASWDAQLMRARQVDVNRAAVEEFERLPAIGPVTAQRIVDHRRQHGPFRDVEDLLDVPGIGEKTLETVRDYVQVGE